MKPTYCYWTAGDGVYVDMMQATVHSAREVGVFKDFHVWSDRPIEGAICHQAGELVKSPARFKFDVLLNEVKQLNYDYFILLDADMYFVRNPGDILRVMQSAPVHVTLESDACAPNTTRPDWWGCPLSRYARLMRAKGVKSNSIFNVNGGFWIVHHDVIETFVDLAMDFWELWNRDGHDPFPEEPALAYAAHMLCGNPYLHTVKSCSDVCVADWLGCYDEELPDGRPWMFEDYFSGERYLVNPAIVHAMRCKRPLVEKGRAIRQ